MPEKGDADQPELVILLTKLLIFNEASIIRANRNEQIDTFQELNLLYHSKPNGYSK
jgi:hypothetical protein